MLDRGSPGPLASAPWPLVPPPATLPTAAIAARTIARALRGRATGQGTSSQPPSTAETGARRGFFFPRGALLRRPCRHKESSMCSILGAFDPRPGADLRPLRPLAVSLSALQRHRGPDWSGVHADRRVLLVHERLAIVDPAGGAQPIRSAGGALVLAVNGEIYNHRELERSLRGDHAFQSGSDCEVINALYAEDDDPGAWLDRLNGIFTF